MLGNLTGVHLLIILAILVLLFGATKLPALAKGLGQSINVFKKEMDIKDGPTTPTAADTNATNTTVSSATTPTAAPQQQPVVNPGPTVQPNTDHRA